MLKEELKDQILQTKLTYLNGYLDALAFLNSNSTVGMRHKLFAYNFSAGEIIKAIQYNSYELFGVYPNDWDLQIEQIENWENTLETEFDTSFSRKKSFNNRSIETQLADDIIQQYKLACKHFIDLIKTEFINEHTTVYELKVKTNGSFYRLVGLDLVFEIDDTKILLLQITGSD